MYKQKLLITMTVAAISLSACATTEEKLTEAGAKRLNAAQVESHIVGNTEKWTKGGGYYNPNGTLEVVWEGADESGPYTIADDGNVCYQIADWGKDCHFYMKDGETVTMIYKGKDGGARDILQGNQLESS